jgi:hypothetical protein
MSEPLSILEEIVSVSSLDTRRLLLSQWIKDWVVSVEKTQHVVNKSVLNSEEVDFVWYTLAQICAEELIDTNTAKTTSTNREFTCSFLALRSTCGKVQEDPENTKRSYKDRRRLKLLHE